MQPVKLKFLFMIQWLYLTNRLSAQSLELISVSEPPPFIFYNSYFTLSWQVKGCHRIIVNNIAVLPGNVGQIQVNPQQMSGSLQLCFEGCGQTIVKTYPLLPLCLQTKQLSHIVLQDRELKQLQASFPKQPGNVKLFPMDVPGFHFQARLIDLVTFPSLLQVQLEAFELPEYNP